MADQATERITIDAPPERCFAVVTDFASYPEWASDVKDVEVVQSDADGRGGLVAYRVAAMGRSSSYTLRYYYGSNPLRVAWRLTEGDITRSLDGEYVFETVPGDPDKTDVTYNLEVDVVVPLPGFVKRRAEARIRSTALEELKAKAEA